jgi:DNA-directed RNA polymerase subunit RPC12/RpoP
MLACGNPAKIEYREYRCLHCGQGKQVVAMSCKSYLCLRCAKVAVDKLGEPGQQSPARKRHLLAYHLDGAAMFAGEAVI